MSEFTDAINALSAEKDIPIELIKESIVKALTMAYNKKYDPFKTYTDPKKADDYRPICEVRIDDDLSEIKLYAKMLVLDGIWDPAVEMELEDARKIDPEVQEGDFLLVEKDIKEFGRALVSIGKQIIHGDLNSSARDNLLREFKDKIGQVIIGYTQREYRGTIYVDLGKDVEGVLPLKEQNPRETYEMNERLRVYVKKVDKSTKTNTGIQVILSRADANFVRILMENEIPELTNGDIIIKSISREAGYRTKVAVWTNKLELDPVGSCVGARGVRIQNVIKELENERIDVVSYDEDPRKFIANALSPSTVEKVYIKDKEKREAIAVVSDEQYSIAIGSLGKNVRLASVLCDWTIDVKTQAEFAEMDEDFEDYAVNEAEALFSGSEENVVYEDVDEVIVSKLPGVDPQAAQILKDNGFDEVQAFIDAQESGKLLEIGLSQDVIDSIAQIINENVEFEEEVVEEAEGTTEAEEEVEYQCPECGAVITEGMTKCPNCGCEFDFEEE